MTGHNNSGTGGDGSAWAVAKRQEVRPYALTGGRTRPRHAMRLLTVLATTSGADSPDANCGGLGFLAPEAAQAVQACRRRACSVAEISALIGQPVLVTKIILSDLIERGVLVIPHAQAAADGRPSVQLLESLLSGLKERFSDAA